MTCQEGLQRWPTPQGPQMPWPRSRGTAAIESAPANAPPHEVLFDQKRGPGRWFAWIYGCVQHIGLRYGDSAYFVRRDDYRRVGGFRPLPLFEDLDLRQRLCRQGRFIRVSQCVTTSSRRFEGRSAPLTFARGSLCS